MSLSHLTKRSVTIAGHATSIALEPEFWAVLDDWAHDGNVALAALVETLDASRPPEHPLTSFLRLAALEHVRQRSGADSGPSGNVDGAASKGAPPID